MANLLLAVIYIAFISLGLPDAVLGAAWPTMSGDLHAPISWAGGISMTISAGTIVSALLSDRMTLRFGAGKVTAVSVALTAFALFGFSISPNYWMLLLFAIPYGLGAGGVGADMIHAICSHGYGITVECGTTIDVEPLHEMEKVLFAADELTGLIWAAALMRPSKSTKDMELKSLKKKYKSKGFAAGCSREVIERGAAQLGWDLEKLLTMTLQAMAATEDEIKAEMDAE